MIMNRNDVSFGTKFWAQEYLDKLGWSYDIY